MVQNYTCRFFKSIYIGIYIFSPAVTENIVRKLASFGLLLSWKCNHDSVDLVPLSKGWKGKTAVVALYKITRLTKSWFRSNRTRTYVFAWDRKMALDEDVIWLLEVEIAIVAMYEYWWLTNNHDTRARYGCVSCWTRRWNTDGLVILLTRRYLILT